jgi:hypothetical protein
MAPKATPVGAERDAAVVGVTNGRIDSQREDRPAGAHIPNLHPTMPGRRDALAVGAKSYRSTLGYRPCDRTLV